MRTIKYRGKDVKTGEWKYGHLITLNVNDKTAYLIITDDYAVVDKELKPWEIAFFLNVDIFMVDPNTVGQFTGLLDKNGKEIYEDDIVKYTRYDWKTEGYQKQNLINYCRIYYNETKCAFYYETKFKSGGGGSGLLLFNDERCKKNEIEVIGNIHDNPELLRR